MGDIRSNAVPASRVEDTPEHPALESLDYDQLKKLRNNSRSIRALGFLWGLGGIATAYVGATMNAAPGQDTLLARLLLLYGLVLAVVGPHSAWVRPSWGRVVCIVLSSLALGGNGQALLLGILSLIALVNAGPLFGDNKISHKEVEAALKARTS